MSLLRSRRVGRLAVRLATLTLVMAVVACNNAESQNTGADRFWELHRPYGAAEVEHYSSIAAMSAAADLVVVGRIERVELGRTLSPDDAPLYQAAVTLAIDEVLEGQAPESSLTWELPLFGALDEAQATEAAKAMNATAPDGELVLFLRHKGGAEAGFYRVVNSRGLWAAGGRATLDAPMAEFVPTAQEFPDLPASLTALKELVRNR